MKAPAADRPKPSQLVWTVQEAATALRLHPMTVRAMINRKALPAVRLGRAIRIPIKALEEQISQGLLAQGQARAVDKMTTDKPRAGRGIGRIRDAKA